MRQTDLMKLVAVAQRALGLSQRELGERLGASRRTVSRWYEGSSTPAAQDLERLARLVFPLDAVLAQKLMRVAAGIFAQIGFPPPAPLIAPVAPVAITAPPLPPPPPPPPKELVDSVVVAACDAMDALPRVMRHPLLAAFRRARELGLTVEDVERELSPKDAKKK